MTESLSVIIYGLLCKLDGGTSWLSRLFGLRYRWRAVFSESSWLSAENKRERIIWGSSNICSYQTTNHLIWSDCLIRTLGLIMTLLYRCLVCAEQLLLLHKSGTLQLFGYYASPERFRSTDTAQTRLSPHAVFIWVSSKRAVSSRNSNSRAWCTSQMWSSTEVSSIWKHLILVFCTAEIDGLWPLNFSILSNSQSWTWKGNHWCFESEQLPPH